MDIEDQVSDYINDGMNYELAYSILFSSPDDNFRLGQLGYIHYNYIFMIS